MSRISGRGPDLRTSFGFARRRRGDALLAFDDPVLQSAEQVDVGAHPGLGGSSWDRSAAYCGSCSARGTSSTRTGCTPSKRVIIVGMYSRCETVKRPPGTPENVTRTDSPSYTPSTSV